MELPSRKELQTQEPISIPFHTHISYFTILVLVFFSLSNCFDFSYAFFCVCLVLSMFLPCRFLRLLPLCRWCAFLNRFILLYISLYAMRMDLIFLPKKKQRWISHTICTTRFFSFLFQLFGNNTIKTGMLCARSRTKGKYNDDFSSLFFASHFQERTHNRTLNASWFNCVVNKRKPNHHSLLNTSLKFACAPFTWRTLYFRFCGGCSERVYNLILQTTKKTTQTNAAASRLIARNKSLNGIDEPSAIRFVVVSAMRHCH